MNRFLLIALLIFSLSGCSTIQREAVRATTPPDWVPFDDTWPVKAGYALTFGH